jgi:threonyl-tRNA synthetase
MQLPLSTKRHSLSHLMAHAIKELYPDAQFAIGPSIDDGWYYDIDFVSSKPSEEDFKKIQDRIQELIEKDLPFVRTERSIDEALEWARKINQIYKIEIIEDLAKQCETTVSFYTVGDFEDLCKGPHVEHTGQINAESFKITKLAGAYWRGDEKNKMLTRVYGLAFENKKALQAHIQMLEEAEKRDHRKLGVQLDLFTFSDLVGAGLPLWTPKGMMLRQLLDDFVWELRQAAGYEKVEIPHITRKELYETSGHWDKFKDGLFTIQTREGHFFAMKPMNCPHHTQIYKRRKWSYRELPQRYANTTMVYRDEQSGELSGLSRVRSITQDDAHVFCRPDQVKEEMMKIWHIITAFYSSVGFSLRLRLSCHDPKNMDAYLGDPALWAQAEKELADMVKEQGQEPEIGVGEAAFYGPKLDFMANDSMGREWQVATIQLDMNLPERFELTYTSDEGKDEQVVMIHAAIMGSIERYLAILIEHYAGAFPVWLSPVQVKLLSVADSHVDYCHNLAREMKDQGIRVEIDTAHETVGNKIRKAVQEKIPYLLVIGDKEMNSDKLFVRERGEKEAQEWDKEKFINEVVEKSKKRE